MASVWENSKESERPAVVRGCRGHANAGEGWGYQSLREKVGLGKGLLDLGLRWPSLLEGWFDLGLNLLACFCRGSWALKIWVLGLLRGLF